MTSLKQTMRSLLAEVEKFLVETLKGVKLNSSAKDEKDRILEKVRQLLDEIPGSASSQLDNSFASGGSHKTSGGGDSGGGSASGSFTAAAGDDEAAYNDDIAKIAASDLKNKLQSGLLDKKKKTGFKTWEQMYCVVSQNIFYIYKKQTDTKQKEAFCLTGYEFQEAPGLEKDASKKEACFELTKAGAPSYQFRAGSKEGMVHWREAITKGIQMGPEEEELGETYEDVGQDGDSKEVMFEDPDDIYEECGPDSVVESKPVSSQPPPPVSRPPPKPEPELEAPDELYDDATSTTDLEKKKGEDKAAAPPPLPPGNRRREPPPLPPSSDTPPPPPPKADLPAIPKEIPPPPIPERRPSAADPPPLPSNPPPLPGRGGAAPARVPQLRKPFMDRDEDFENIFFGKWDCEAESGKELSFKQGDMIHVLSRDFDEESWWVGELEGKVGLVPKDFLHPAYILVA